MKVPVRNTLTIIVLLFSIFLAACQPEEDKAQSTNATLRIISGSENELIWNEIVEPWCKENNVSCSFTKKGSVDIMLALQSGNVGYDAVWPANEMWIQLGDSNRIVTDIERIFLSPVVPALRLSEAERLGWVGREVTFAEIVEAVRSGAIDAWMTNPSQSNSGAGMYFALLNYFAGNQSGVPLTQAQLDDPAVQEQMKAFLEGIDKSSESTGFLKDTCLDDYDKCPLIFVYESLVIEANQQLIAEGKEPLYALYPDGLAIADSPLGYIQHDGRDKSHEAFLKLQEFLLSDATQQRVSTFGRRPIGIGFTQATDTTVFNPAWGIDTTIVLNPLVYPSRDILTHALDAYRNLRKPSMIVFCLDGSGSMAENGWSQLEDAVDVIFDPEESRRVLLEPSSTDKYIVYVFNDHISGGGWRSVGTDTRDTYNHIRSHDVGGGTDMYTCLRQALRVFIDDGFAGYRPSIILMTDGQSSGDKDSFFDMSDDFNEAQGLRIPVYSITFGDADRGQLDDVSQDTGGAVFDGRSDLQAAFRQARGSN